MHNDTSCGLQTSGNNLDKEMKRISRQMSFSSHVDANTKTKCLDKTWSDDVLCGDDDRLTRSVDKTAEFSAFSMKEIKKRLRGTFCLKIGQQKHSLTVLCIYGKIEPKIMGNPLAFWSKKSRISTLG
jgi:hypothetical protein